MSERNFSEVESALKTRASEHPSRHAVLTEILGAIGQNDFAAVAKHLTEHAELHISGTHFMDGSWRGRDKVLGAIAANFDRITEQKSEVEAMIQQGDAIALLIREHGRLKPDGKPYGVRGVIWWTFEGDRLARVEEFLHPAD
jgi:ketosteroid isomerase-like protein